MSDDPTIFSYEVPSGRRLEEPGRPNRVGSVGDGLDVTPDMLEAARRAWPEAPAADFERVSHRRWTDRASGTEYRRVHGVPLFGDGGRDEVDTFFVDSGRFFFLRRSDRAEGETRMLGAVGSRRASARERAT